MSTGVGCVLYVNGARFADGSPGDDLANPTALSGLKVDWGRETTVDQPEAATCVFQVMDRRGGDGFLGLLTTGLTVDVMAEGMVFPDPTESTFADPSFETGQGGRVASNAAAVLSARRVASGAQSLQVTPADATRSWTVRLAPDAFQPSGTHPDAWDDIVRTDDGQQWAYGASLFVPAGIMVTIRPVLYTGPWQGSYVVPSGAGQVTAVGNGTWQTVRGTFYPAQANTWVGVSITAWPSAGIAWGQVTPPSLTWLDADSLQGAVPDSLWWADLGAVYVDDVAVLAPAAGVEQRALVFHGRITDLKAAYDDNDQIEGPVIEVSAVDFTADLENVDIGDEPWPDGQPMSARFARVIALSGMPVAAVIDARPGAMLLCYQDVDSQAATGLLQDLATSTDAVLWSAVHQTTGQYLWVEDTRARLAMSTLAMGTDGLVHIVPTAAAAGALDLSSCWVLRDPVEFIQDVSDVFTRAAVTWNEFVPPDPEDVGAQPSTTEHTYTVVDVNLEAVYGRRREQVTTLLRAEADAADVATAILTRTSATDWRVQGVTVDDAFLTGTTAEVAMMMTLLDGTRRIGLPVRITDLPPWSPSGDTVTGYVEGGSFVFDEGTWTLDLTISRAKGTGQALVRWADSLPAWRWTDYAPDIRWSDLQGVAPPQAADDAAAARTSQPIPEEVSA